MLMRNGGKNTDLKYNKLKIKDPYFRWLALKTKIIILIVSIKNNLQNDF